MSENVLPILSSKNFMGSCLIFMGTSCGAVVKNPPANAGDACDAGLIPGSGRSPGVENSNPLFHREA